MEENSLNTTYFLSKVIVSLQAYATEDSLWQIQQETFSQLFTSNSYLFSIAEIFPLQHAKFLGVWVHNLFTCNSFPIKIG